MVFAFVHIEADLVIRDVGSRQFKDFEDYLLPSPRFEAQREQHELGLAVETNCGRYLESRFAAMDEQMKTVERLAAANELPDASITNTGQLKINPLENAVPDEAAALMQQAYGLLPHLKITELLLEVDGWIGFSHWEYACVVVGGESFEALSAGLQNALWQAGGCPREHRTDSLSAAFKNLQQQDDFTARYSALLEHYAMNGTRNNLGLAHENGSVESSHRHLKEAVDQALMLRGHRDFADRPAYDTFLREVVMRRNRRNAAAFNAEREHLRALPLRRTTEFVEEEARITRCATFTVRGVLYSAPSRLIGQRLKVRLYADRLDCYLSGALVHSTPRRIRSGTQRLRVLDYRHFIEALKRKPQAFKGLVFRDDLFPREAYRRTWEQLEARLAPRQACKVMVGLLELAAYHGVEAALAERLDVWLDAGQLPDIERLRQEIMPPCMPCPELFIEMPQLALYDSLLEEGVMA
jgi:hypothetical protein